MKFMLANFPPGQIVTTPGADEALATARVRPMELVGRHLAGDWGDMGEEDKKANDDAVKNGGRIFSGYILPSGKKVWVITEWDRSYTTLLLPDEY